MAVSSDVVENILTRLDVKDLLLCKSVCKSWYSLISSPYFTKAHLKHNIFNSNNNDVGHTRIAMPTVWKIPNHDNEMLHQYSDVWKVVGSSNGLVCVFSFLIRKDPLILLVNPWTREVRELPMAPLLPQKIHSYALVCPSFAYDSSTDDYKVVMGYKKKDVDEAIVQVLSLKSNTWKLIGHINCWFRYGTPGVFLNGAFHWFAYDSNTTYNYIYGKPYLLLSFDSSREEFKEIPKPDDSRYFEGYTTLGIFEDNLCISCEDLNGPYYRIWVMRNYNVKQSWEFLPNDYEMKSHDAVHYMNIYDCTSPKKKRMTFYCDDKIVLSRSGKYITDAPIFVQSLVSPYVNCDSPSHAGSAKVAERECKEMHVFEKSRKRNYWMQSIKALEHLLAEDGQNEKSYLCEGGETKRRKRQKRDVNNMPTDKKAIVEILTKEDKSGGRNKRTGNN